MSASGEIRPAAAGTEDRSAESIAVDRSRGAIRLGLIGDNIDASQSPRLHRLAGRLCGVEVDYELLVPPRIGDGFGAVLARCRERGYRGVNVTYPYKETVVPLVNVADPEVRALGGVNTVVFGASGPAGYNTDFTGFISAWRHGMGGGRPGVVCLLGAGGVGKAVAFALLRLGVDAIRIHDRDRGKAALLASALTALRPAQRFEAVDDSREAARGADGLVNCTPLGMVGFSGTPLAREHMRGARWAFDAVYTPVDTAFLGDAAAEGLAILSGYELFFHQGIDAFEHFAGRRPDEDALRRALAASPD